MYNAKWSENIVKEHYTRHARASYTLMTLSGISTRELTKWLMNNDPAWNCWKMLVLALEQEGENALILGDTTHLLSICESFFRKNTQIGGVRLLRSIEKGSKLELRLVSSASQTVGQTGERWAGDLPGQLHFQF